MMWKGFVATARFQSFQQHDYTKPGTYVYVPSVHMGGRFTVYTLHTTCYRVK
jgi:hypothetical protein